MTKVTYKHLVAGSTVITPSGKTLRFNGKPGGIGYYETEDAGEIELLDSIDKIPTSQLERVRDEAAADVITKPVDPAIAQASEDAAESSARVTAPAVLAAQENLAKTIAAAKK